MKKFLSITNIKKFIALTICFMLCFSCAFVATGCVLGDPGSIDDGAGSGNTGNNGSNGGNGSNGTDNNNNGSQWNDILEELEVSEYIDGAILTYKTSPEMNKIWVNQLKTEFTNKINTILTNINGYISYLFSMDNEYTLENEILLSYLKEVTNISIPSEITENNDKIEYLLPYLDHFGMFKNEEEILKQIILNKICALKQSEVDTYLTNNPNFAQEIGKQPSEITILDIDETLYNNYDQKTGFGAEKYTGTITQSKISDFNKDKVEDLDGNNALDLWTKQTFIAKGLCTENNYTYENYHYALKYDENDKLVLDAVGIENNYTVKAVDVYTNADKTESAKAYILVANETEPIPVYYNDFNKKFLDENQNEINLNWLALIKDNIFIYNNFLFDTANSGFKNYLNVVSACVENVCADWQKLPFALVQQLSLDKMTVDVSNIDADFYDNDILTNKPNSGVAISGILLDIKQKVNIKSIEVYFEFEDEQNLDISEITINVGAQYYNKNSNTLTTYTNSDLGSVRVKMGKTEAISENLDSQYSGGIDIDFTRKFGEKGITLNPLVSNFNGGENLDEHALLTQGINNGAFTAVYDENKGTVVSYIDTSSDYLVLTFNVDDSCVVEGITPSFKICFFNFSLVSAD